MNAPKKGKAGTELKTVDDLGAVSLGAGSHHVLTYKGDEGGSLAITRSDKDDGSGVTVLIDGKPKTLKPGDAHTVPTKADGSVEVASTSGGEFVLEAKLAKAPKEEKAK